MIKQRLQSAKLDGEWSLIQARKVACLKQQHLRFALYCLLFSQAIWTRKMWDLQASHVQLAMKIGYYCIPASVWYKTKGYVLQCSHPLLPKNIVTSFCFQSSVFVNPSCYQKAMLEGG